MSHDTYIQKSTNALGIINSFLPVVANNTNSQATNVSLHTCPWQTYRRLTSIHLVEKPSKNHRQLTYLTHRIRFQHNQKMATDTFTW